MTAKAGRWAHLHETVLLSGEDIRGIYPYGPVIGPDGYAHMTITWRETPIASSNHDLSYARSQDLISWESSDGSPIKLPIVLATGEIIDPIPEHGGLLNGRHPIGFDKQNRVLVTYQKYNEDKLSQVYINRREADGWVIKQVSDWDNDIPQRVIPMMEDQSRKSTEYYLSWEAMQPNRDQARADIPPASTLRVHRIPK